PLAPAFAVMLGAAAARLAERWPLKLGYLPLVFLILCQGPALRDNIETRRQAIVHHTHAHKLAEYLRAHKLKTVIAAYRHDWMNFALGEEFVFCPLRNARYQPNIQQAELAEDVGVLDNHGGFVEFLAVSGGSMQTGKVAHGFVPPRGGWREIPLGLVRHSSESDGGGDVVVRDGHGGRVEALTDRDMDTGWNSQAAGKVEETLTIAFPSPIELSGMRLVNADLAYPPVIRLEGRQDTGSPWQILSTLDPVPGLFWSGPRPFWYGRFHRAECRFTPRQVSVVRVVVPPFKRAMQWDLKEIQLFAPAPASALWTPAGPGGPGASAGGYRTALPDLLRLLQERDIRHLYSDRWLANVVYSETGGRVATEREPGIFPEAGLSSSNIVRWSPDMALVCLESDAPCTREVLESRDIHMRETAVGHWVLFDFEPALKPGSAAESNRTSESAQWREEYRGNPGVYWAGFGCFQAQDKRWAVKLMRDAEIRRIDVGVNEEVLRLLDMAARAYPDSPQIRQRLAGYLRQAGRDEEARAIERASDVRWKPDIPALADFERGIRLLGISMEPRRVKAGEQVRIRYYWQCPLGWNDRPTAVFVHFMDASVRFQDDHPLLEGVNTDEQPLPETFVEERRLEVSRSAAPGATQIRLGLYRPQKGGRRHAVRTALPVERRAVLMPVSLDIGPAGPLPVPSRVER
ncbi:MAG: hypothetical protein HY343_08735, partial [Lentisphaerae bacterium]|nr:hypothetical protein [Lentisphaerota bacterium]